MLNQYFGILNKDFSVTLTGDLWSVQDFLKKGEVYRICMGVHSLVFFLMLTVKGMDLHRPSWKAAFLTAGLCGGLSGV